VHTLLLQRSPACCSLRWLGCTRCLQWPPRFRIHVWVSFCCCVRWRRERMHALLKPRKHQSGGPPRRAPDSQPSGAQFRAPRASSALRLLEAVGLAAGTVAAMLLLSYSLGTCVDVPKWHEKNYGFTLKCESGYNDLATAFMSFPDETIRHLFSLGSLTPQCALAPVLTLILTLPYTAPLSLGSLTLQCAPAPVQPQRPRAGVRALDVRAARARPKPQAALRRLCGLGVRGRRARREWLQGSQCCRAGRPRLRPANSPVLVVRGPWSA